MLKTFDNSFFLKFQASFLVLSIDYNSHRNKAVFYIYGTIFVFIIMTISTELYLSSEYGVDIILEVLYVIQSFYCILFIFQFICPAIAVRERFEILKGRKMKTKSDVHLTLDIYEKLFECVMLINENLTNQLIYVFELILITVTFEFHNVVATLLNESSVNFIPLTPSLAWIFFYLCYVIIAVHPASNAASVFKQFNSIEYQILKILRYSDQTSYQFYKAFLKYINGYKRKFETIFFDIDWRLLFGVRIKSCFERIDGLI